MKFHEAVSLFRNDAEFHNLSRKLRECIARCGYEYLTWALWFAIVDADREQFYREEGRAFAELADQDPEVKSGGPGHSIE